MVFVLAFLIMAVVTAAMAIGALAGRGPLKGSCGGIAALGIDEGRCAICGDDWASTGSATASTGSATEEDNSDAAGADFYDAGSP